MAYIGNDLQVAYPTYKNIDDISGSFNGSTTSFALLVGGVAPSPLPLNSQQCLISVGGVLQRPDDTGSEGFRLSGGNIIFSSAPSTGEDFFGVILAGADYVNAGANFPSGSVGAPSITFDSDPDTGIYNSAANQVGVTCAGSSVSVFSSAGQSFLAGSAGAPSLYPTGDTNTGFWSPAADTIAISTGGSERTRVDSSGRLLVGTSSARSNVDTPGGNSTPFVQIETTAGSYSNGLSIINNSVGTFAPILTLGATNGGSVGSNTIVTNNQYFGTINFVGADGTNLIEGASIRAEVDGTPGTNDMPGRLVFSTTADGASSPTERFRINSAGQFTHSGATTTILSGSPGRSFALGERSTAAASTTIQVSSLGNSSVYSYISDIDYFNHFLFTWRGSLAGQITSANNTTVSYTSASDYRLKDNVVNLTDGWERVKQLNPKQFEWKSAPGVVVDGFLAHEAQEVVPESVFGDKDATYENGDPYYQVMENSRLIPVLTAALKEALIKIETLEAKVAALEAS